MAIHGTIYLLISTLITEFKQNYWKYFYKEKACIAPFVSATYSLNDKKYQVFRDYVFF